MTMRVFVSNVDTFVGHNVSRLLSLTEIGSRRPHEEDQEEAEGVHEGETMKPVKQPQRYTVIGTLGTKPNSEHLIFESKPGQMVECGDKQKDMARREAIQKFAVAGNKPLWVAELVDNEDKEQLKQAVLSADVVIYDLTKSLDEALWVAELLHSLAETFEERPRKFIALSTVMTWAKTKVDPEDPDALLTEEDYRRRKSHPNFKKHLEAEKEIMKLGKKSSFSSYIIAPGLVYHSGDCIFHYLFKSAWHNEEELLCYGEGLNTLPTIHLDDLCNIVVEVVDTVPEQKYILAIDESRVTLLDITKNISEAMSTGKVKSVPKETAFLQRDLSQEDFDMLTTHLRLEPGVVKDMSFDWKYESGIVENLPALIQDYKNARGLYPLKVVIHGPPASGKTTLAKKIAQHYSIHYVEPEEIMKGVVDELEKSIAAASQATEDTDDSNNQRDIEADRELLEELRDHASKNGGKYPDAHVTKFVRQKLRSMPCRNQGFVLDGYPATTEEAQALFKNGADEDADGSKADELLLPEFVISLECTDEFIKERIMGLPEDQIANTKNSEEAFLKRLDNYHATNTDDNTILNFFDEQDIHPLVINIESVPLDKLVETVVKNVGGPRNYGPSVDEIRRQRALDQERRVKDAQLAEEDRARKEKEESDRHAKAIAEWNTRMDEVHKQEREVLEAQSVPLRNYLMKYVMPTLTQALIDVCKVRPEDPVDYVAEFLFKHNPGNSA